MKKNHLEEVKSCEKKQNLEFLDSFENLELEDVLLEKSVLKQEGPI